MNVQLENIQQNIENKPGQMKMKTWLTYSSGFYYTQKFIQKRKIGARFFQKIEIKLN